MKGKTMSKTVAMWSARTDSTKGKTVAKKVATGIYLVGLHYRAQVPKFKGCGSNERKNFDNLDDAIRWRGAAQAAIDRGEPIPAADLFRSSASTATPRVIARDVHLVRDVAASYFDWFERERGDEVTYRHLRTTKKTLDTYVVAILGDRDISAVTEEDAYAIRDQLREKGLHVTTAKRILKLFRFVFRHAIHHGLVEKNPFAYVKAKQPPRAKQMNKWAGEATPYQSLADARRLADRLGGVFAAIVWLQRICGLRISEALGISLGDVNWSNGWLTIRAQAGHLFRVLDDNGDWVAVDRTTELKTKAAEREVVIPRILLLQLRRLVLEVYDIDPVDGGFDESAPLLAAKAGQLPRMRMYYLAYGVARAALGMDPDEVNYRRTGHNDREFANTDLARSEVVPVLVRNQFMGHEPEVEPGGSKTNARHYLGFRKFEPLMHTIAEFFDAQVRSELGDDVQLVGDLTAPTVDYDAFTMAEFCQLSGAPRSTAWAWVDRGELPCERHETSNGTPLILIRAEDAYEFLDRCHDVWTVRRAAETLHVPAATITYWLNTDQVTGSKLGKHWIIDLDSLKQRIEDGTKFIGNGISLSEAGKFLNSTPAGVDHLVATGALVGAGTDAYGRTRVTRESVMKYRTKLLSARPCERLPSGRLGIRQGDPYAYRRRHVVRSPATDS